MIERLTLILIAAAGCYGVGCVLFAVWCFRGERVEDEDAA